MQRDVTPATDLASFRANLSRRLDILNPPPASTRCEAAAWRRRLRTRSHGTGIAPCQRGAAPGSWQPLPCPNHGGPHAAGAIAPTGTPRGPGKRCHTAELVLGLGLVQMGKGSRWEPPSARHGPRSSLLSQLRAPSSCTVTSAGGVAWHPTSPQNQAGRVHAGGRPPPSMARWGGNKANAVWQRSPHTHRRSQRLRPALVPQGPGRKSGCRLPRS